MRVKQVGRPEHGLIARHLRHGGDHSVAVQGAVRRSDEVVDGGEGLVFEVQQDLLDVLVAYEMKVRRVVGRGRQEDHVQGCGRGDDHGEPLYAQDEGGSGVELGDIGRQVCEICE